MKTRFHPGAVAAFAALALTIGACSSNSSKTAAATTTSPPTTSGATTAAPPTGPLVGTFAITAADCATGAPTKGSYFRMVQAKGTVSGGPFISNADSACGDKTYTALAPGTDGGLKTGTYEPQPDAVFDATKNGLAAAITSPTKFFAVNFAVSTNPKDPQSGAGVAAPTVTVGPDGTLSGDVRAVTVAWNGQQFNQGAPKPDGSLPGLTKDLTGTYDPTTHAYTIEWTSQIVGGPFNGFTGVWHLEGTFTAS